MGSHAESHELNTLLHEECHDQKGAPKIKALRVWDGSTIPILAQRAKLSRPTSSELFRQSYLLFLVSLYSCLSIIAWTIICVQTKRPITTHTYSYVSNADDLHGVLANRMKQNADWFRAAKILLAITNTLIIPLTSTVCASAAVIYVQNFGRRRRFTMQHTATLADKGWSSPQVWLALLKIKGWKSRGSYFLVFAMGFHALGFLIGPLQQYYIGQETFKFQTVSLYGLQGATDVLDLFRGGDNELQTAMLRNELASVTPNDFQPNIWQEGTPQCSSNFSYEFGVSPECQQGGLTFDSIANLSHPYVVQLPAGYQTGLMTQFMPRMNSSVSLLNVSQTAFPSDCNTSSGAYYIEYSYNTSLLNVQVCIPDGVSQSPWKATRARQDATETMFMNIHFGSSENLANFDPNPGNITLKLTINTTLGYFELPNYNKNGTAGPLLAKDPICPGDPADDDQCLAGLKPKRSLQTNESSSSYDIDNVPNLGPLAMIVAAMFEPGSFIATQIPNGTKAPDPATAAQPVPCTIPPLNLLFDGGHVSCDNEPFSSDDGYVSITQWLTNFHAISNMQDALHAAAILASQVWLNSVNLGGAYGELDVQYDMGQDSIRPKIPSAGIILLSILLAIDLLLLLAVASYISFSYTWAGAFDSSAMMRLGAARADELPLQVISSEGKENTKATLERMPGWVGDARPDDEVGALEIGATVPLKAHRKYEAFLDM